jgi:lipoprotein-releasing system ATP-binding protein
LSKRYGEGDASTLALQRVNFEVYHGEFVLIVGQSGSGKSTLLNMIGLLDRPTFGTISIDGVEATGLSDFERSELRRNKIGFIFQSYNLLSDLSVVENVMLPLLMTGQPAGGAKDRAERLLGHVGLRAQVNKQANQLSGGQMQRVAIARALINRPALVLGDEPTGNLDSKSSQDVIALMKNLNRRLNQTFVVITHSREIFGDVDKVITIKDGMVENIESFARPAPPA